MPSTYELIASNTVGSTSVSSVTFSSIPSTYTDLMIQISTRDDYNFDAFAHVSMRFNGDTGANYLNCLVRADGTSAISSSTVGGNFISASYSNGNLATANSFGNGGIYIFNYANLVGGKTVSIESANETNATTAYMNMTAGYWGNAGAITSINFSNQLVVSNFTQYSTFYLYGIKNS
jgi:hypothetical protein